MVRFRVRPQPFIEESLTGYMMRTASENDVPNLGDLFRNLNIRYVKSITRRAYQWDMFPFRVGDTETLCQWMSLSENMLNTMTFSLLNDKLLMNSNENNNGCKNPLASSLVKNQRRFCPKCLKERGFYNLIWQVSEIEICDIHHIKLQSKCSVCSTEQPYVANHLGEFKCVNNCRSLIEEVSETADDIEYINDQLRKYEDWRFLIHSEVEFIPRVGDLPPQKSLITALLYITQRESNEFRLGLNFVLSKGSISNMRKFVAEDGHMSRIQLNRILAIIRKAGLSLQQFSRLSIPVEFIKSLFNWPRDILQPCQTPWCPSCGDTRSMVRVKHQQHIRYKEVKYIKHSVCTECWVQYGEDTRDGHWKSVGDFIILANQIRVLLEQGYSRHAARVKLKIGARQFSRILGYLLYHRMLRDDIWRKLVPVLKKPDNLLQLFRETVDGGGGSLAHAKSLHGWDEIMYNYFLADPEVQRYYIFEAYKHRRLVVREVSQRKKGIKKVEIEAKVDEVIARMIEREISITGKEVAATMGIAYTTLRYHGLQDKIQNAVVYQRELQSRQKEAQLLEVVQQYIHQIKSNGNPVFVEDVCSLIGYNSQHLKAMFPVIADLISNEARIDADERKQRKTEEYKGEAQRIIAELYASGLKITNEDVARGMGTTIVHLRRYYPDVVSYMWKLRGTLA